MNAVRTNNYNSRRDRVRSKGHRYGHMSALKIIHTIMVTITEDQTRKIMIAIRSGRTNLRKGKERSSPRRLITSTNVIDVLCQIISHVPIIWKNT